MSDTREQPDGQTLIALLRHQQTLYRRLRFLADRQKSLVTEDDTESLLALLTERQRLVDGLVGLNEQLAPYRANWTELYACLDEPDRKCVAKLLEEVNTSLGAILQSDSRDTATLTARQQSMAGQLAGFNAGSRVSAAYAKASGAAPSAMTDSEA